MKDYSKMSDFDVTKIVAQLVLLKKKDCEEIHEDEKRGVVSWADGANWHVFDPCNNPSDAWPVISENRISLRPDDMYEEAPHSGYWRADNEAGNHCHHENPLRAAMIVYLMIKDVE